MKLWGFQEDGAGESTSGTRNSNLFQNQFFSFIGKSIPQLGGRMYENRVGGCHFSYWEIKIVCHKWYMP